MDTKAEILKYLDGLGFATPESFCGTQEELAAKSWVPDMYYYCRTLDPEKITVVPNGKSLSEELAAAADHDRGWVVQPLYDFELCGAAFLTPDETYIESAWGSALSVLREGVVGYREARSFSAELFQTTYPQDFQIRFVRGIPQQVPLPENQDTVGALTRQRIQPTLEQVRARSVFGLFEWGTNPDRSVLLDWKPLLDQQRTDNLRDILRQTPMPNLVPDFDRPALATVPMNSLGGQVVFDHGARLSHVVTRAVEGDLFSVLFRR